MPKEEEEGSAGAGDALSAKDAKKAPPTKGKKDAAAEPEELSPEELEARKKLIEEREKQNSAL